MAKSTPSEPEPVLPVLTTYADIVADYNAWAERNAKTLRLSLGPSIKPLIFVDAAGNDVK